MIAARDSAVPRSGRHRRARTAGRRGTRRLVAAQRERGIRSRSHGGSRRRDRARARRRLLALRRGRAGGRAPVRLAPERARARQRRERRVALEARWSTGSGLRHGWRRRERFRRPTTRRRAIDTRTARRAFGSCLVAISARVSVVAGVGTAVAAQLSLLAGASGLVVPLTLGLGTGVGLGLHEAAHVASLRGVPSALVTRGRRTYVLHAPVGPARRSLVAVAGPARGCVSWAWGSSSRSDRSRARCSWSQGARWSRTRWRSP